MDSAAPGTPPRRLRPRQLADELARCRETGEAPVQLVDVREDAELALARLPETFIHLPLSRAGEWSGRIREILDPARPVAVLCHAGVRSWQVSCWLVQEQGYGEVWNIEGGIEAWSLEVDASVPRY